MSGLVKTTRTWLEPEMHPRHRTKTIMLVLLGCNVLAGAAASAQEPAVDGMSRVRAYLDNPPWIRNVKFRLSGNQFFVTARFGGRDQRRIQLGGWLEFEGALQPTGFYLRYPANSIENVQVPRRGPMTFKHVPAGKESVFGATGRYFWQLQDLHKELILAPKLAEEGQSPDNGPEIICVGERNRYLGSFQRMGMHHLVWVPIDWVDSLKFRGESPVYGLIEGHVSEQYEDGLPRAIEYAFQNNGSWRFVLRYEYDENRSLPPKCIITQWTDYITRKNVTSTNIVDEWEPGLDESIANGYPPVNVESTVAIPQTVIIWSNGIRYVIGRGGLRSPMPSRVPDYRALEPSSRLVPALLFTAAFLVVFITIARLGIARRKTNSAML